MTENNTSWRSCLDDQMKRGGGNNDRSSSSAVRKRVDMDHQNREHETSNRDSFDIVKMKSMKSALLTPDTSIGRATSTPIKCPSPSFADMNRDESIKHEEEYYNARSWKLYNRINNKNKKREQKGKTLKAARRHSILNMESSPDRFSWQQQRRRSSVATQQRRRSSTASLSFLPNMQYESRRSSMVSTTSVEKGVFNLEF